MRRDAALCVMLMLVGCGGGAPSTIPDPATFDCRAVSAPPARRSPVPEACVVDPTCRAPMLSGHRGVGLFAPEDTLSAYRAAIAFGLEFVETDPRPTADGVIVNIHDPDVDRTTDGTGAVDRLTFAEIRALHIDAEGMVGDFGCERVPTLVEILQLCRGRAAVLVDANKTARVDLLVAAIREADALGYAIFDTSSVDKIDAALAIEPRLLIMNRPDSVEQTAAELDHFAPRLPALVELGAGDRAQAAAVVHARGGRTLTDVFLADVAAQVAEDFSVYQQILDDGIDVMQTNRPDLALEALRMRGLR
jgi:glycerophosphoryl diester phosphodiesterase